ncbi:MAG: WG repeat-containing protein [Rhodothermales bacterium]
MRLLRSLFLLALVAAAGCTAVPIGVPPEVADRLPAPVPAEQVAAGADRFPIAVRGRWGYIDRAGEVVIEPQFDGAYAFAEGLARVEIDGRYGYIDPAGAVVLSPVYRQAFDFAEGRARVVLPTAGAELGSDAATAEARLLEAFIATDGTVIVPATLSRARDFGRSGDSTLAPVVRMRTRSYVPLGLSALAFLGVTLQDEGGWEVVGAGGDMAFRVENALNVLGLVDGRLPFAQNVGTWPFRARRWGYLDTEGRVAIAPQFRWASGFSEGRAAVVLDDRYGYIDTTGALVIPPQFGRAGAFSEARAPVRRAGQWGFVDRDGRVIVPAQYDFASEFSDGRALVQRGGQFGFVDADGAEVIPLRYDYARSFRDGLAFVRDGDREGYIDPDGAFVWSQPATPPR